MKKITCVVLVLIVAGYLGFPLAVWGEEEQSVQRIQLRSQPLDEEKVDVPRRVLFIGNSLTYYNDLPSQVAAMAKDLGVVPPMQTDSMTYPDARLSFYLGAKAMDKIRNGNWDVVVLQGHGREPLQAPDAFFSAAALLAQEARSAGAEVIFFETWAHASGHYVYKHAAWSGGNYKEMQARLRIAYSHAAELTKSSVAYVGSIWEMVLEEHEEIKLYVGDGVHPNECGSYLAACVLITFLTDCDPRNTTWLPSYGVTESEAKVLRAYAHRGMTQDEL
jgi:hypothetical protein